MRTTATRLGATFVVLISIFAFPCLAVTPAHFWSLTGNGNTSGSALSVAIAPSNGDVVATGYYFGTMDLGTGPLVANATFGAGDAWLARFNRAGQVKWAKHFGDSGSEGGIGVAVDAAGNIYTIGNFNSFVDFGGGDLPGGIYVVKLDANGNHIWSHGFGSTTDGVTSVNLDPSGNVIVTGYFSGTINFGGTDLTSAGAADAFIVKFNSNGVWQWNMVGGGGTNDVTYSATTDAAGNIYATGGFNTTATFPGFPPLNSAGDYDVFILKANSAGVIQWIQRRGGTGLDIGFGIGSDPSGNIAVTGVFSNSCTFGGSTLVSAGGYDGFLAKYNTSGVHQWSLRFGSTGDIETGYNVVVNSSGKVFLAATSYVDVTGAPGAGTNDFLLAKYSSTGTLAWSRLVGSNGDDRCNTIAVDVGDNVVVGGNFQGGVDFGGGIRKATGQDNLVLARYGLGEPAITTIKDVGNDQGRNVRITLSRSPLDDGSAALPITEYQAWRRILPLPVALVSRGNGPQALPSGTWEFVGSIPASNLTSYRMIAPTEADSTVTLGMYRSKFFVRAATANPSIFYDSPVDSGYSRDNLAPGIPSNFAYVAGNLSWNKSGADDFDYFSVYGSSTNSFGAATLIDYTVSSALDVTASDYSYYWVTATDFSGNEGRPAKVNKTTGVGDTPLPHVLSVSAYPNPFNPETTVRYTLPARGHVRLDIFDLRGERVATLVDREQDTGAFTVTWRGRDDAGANVGSGVYFAKLSVDGAVRTYKLTLLK